MTLKEKYNRLIEYECQESLDFLGFLALALEIFFGGKKLKSFPRSPRPLPMPKVKPPKES